MKFSELCDDVYTSIFGQCVEIARETPSRRLAAGLYDPDFNVTFNQSVAPLTTICRASFPAAQNILYRDVCLHRGLASTLAFIDALHSNVHLQERVVNLSLWGDELVLDATLKLLALLPSLQNLQIASCPPRLYGPDVASSILEAIRPQRLQCLYLDLNPNLHEADLPRTLARLLDLPSLKLLHLNSGVPPGVFFDRALYGLHLPRGGKEVCLAPMALLGESPQLAAFAKSDGWYLSTKTFAAWNEWSEPVIQVLDFLDDHGQNLQSLTLTLFDEREALLINLISYTPQLTHLVLYGSLAAEWSQDSHLLRSLPSTLTHLVSKRDAIWMSMFSELQRHTAVHPLSPQTITNALRQDTVLPNLQYICLHSSKTAGWLGFPEAEAIYWEGKRQIDDLRVGCAKRGIRLDTNLDGFLQDLAAQLSPGTCLSVLADACGQTDPVAWGYPTAKRDGTWLVCLPPTFGIALAGNAQRMASPPPSPYPSSLPASQLRSQPVNPKVDQLIHHFYTKAASIIVQSRVSHVDAQASHRRPSSSHSSHHLGRKIDKWFNLETEDTDLFREELKTWRSPTATIASIEPVPAMVLDILLDVSELDPTQATVLYDSSGSRHRVDTASRNILLERWALTLLPAPPAAPPELPALYKQGIILFRALYALIRALPVYQLSKRLRKRKGGTGTGLRIGCRMSTGLNDGLSSDEDDARPSNRPPREFNLDERLVEDAVVETAAQHFVFAPIHTPIGSLFLECRYRAQADFGVEDKEALLSSRFLNEDFFRPSLRLRVGSQPPTSLHHSPADKLAPSYGSLSSRHSAGPVPFAQASRLSTSPAGTASDESQRESTSRDPRDSGEGAFITASSISRPPRSSASPIPHQASPRPPPRMASSPQPIGGSQRFSGSSGFGPSSSLRYTSFSKYGSSPFETSGSAPRPMPNPVQRYSSSKYARSYSSTGSSGGNELASSPAFGPESLGRRSRLGSFTSSSLKEGAPSSATSFSSRLPPGTSSAEVDEINSFLEMIDSRPQLTSIANGARSTYLSRSQADSKLRALADSLSALPSGMQPSTSASNSTRLRSQPIEEEEDYESSAAGLAGVREEAEPVDDSVRQRAEAQPSSYPRYEQTRRPLVQTGFFFPHSASSSPKATAVASSSAEAPKAPTPPSTNKPVFPRYISKSRSQSEHGSLTVEERQVRRTSYSGVEEETMGHLELSLTASRPEESAAPPEPPSWPHAQPEHPPWRGRDSSLPPFARGRQRPSVALYERQRGGARSDKLKDSSSSASSG